MDPIAKLKAELEAKKRKLDEVAAGRDGVGGAAAAADAPKKKVYRTNGQTKQLMKGMHVSVAAASGHQDGAEGPFSPEQTAAQSGGSKKWIPKEEVIKRLRALRAPITLFGEGDEARLTRLRKLELSRPDEDNEGTAGQKNFLLEEQKKATERAAKGDYSSDEEELTPEERRAKKLKRLEKLKEAEDKAVAKGDDNDEIVRSWLRRMLKEWEVDLDELPIEVTRSVQGRNEVNNYKQTKEYVKPLMKSLKQRSLAKDILRKLTEMAKLCRDREYIKAADVYLILSIGKAAWPMGATMVGIHERAAREKIGSQGVAHILNDETQRKYIQCVKRIMTYAQNKYPVSFPILSPLRTRAHATPRAAHSLTLLFPTLSAASHHGRPLLRRARAARQFHAGPRTHSHRCASFLLPHPPRAGVRELRACSLKVPCLM